MADIILKPLDESRLLMLAVWFWDREIRRRLGGMLPLRRWYNYVATAPGRYVWMAYEGEAAVGFADLELTSDETAAMALLVNPQLRRRGYGKRILQALVNRPETAALKTIEAGVEWDNVASLHCFTSAGFAIKDPKPDKDGIITLIYARHEACAS
jgi:L-amino acid N-acyltransferase YncA